MADTDLVFGSPASEVTTHLVFGATDTPVIADAPVTVTVLFGAPVVSVHPYVAQPVSVAVGFSMSVSVRATYVSGASRPTVAEVGAAWQAGQAQGAGIVHKHTVALPAHITADVRSQQGAKLHSLTVSINQTATPAHAGYRSGFQDGARIRTSARSRHQDGIKTRSTLSAQFQQGVPVRASSSVRHQDALRDRRNRTAGRWQVGVRKSLPYTGSARSGLHVDKTLDGRHQQSRKPQAGMWDRVIPVIPTEPCYTPSGELIFKALWDGSTDLVFVCDTHGGEEPHPATVVVPVKRVYVVLNESSLRRVDGNIPIPTFSLSLSLDKDSWTWSFSASLPGEALALIQPVSADEPVVVEVMVNGVPYRMQITARNRDRSFNASGIRISGRGLSAILDSPYAPIRNHTNDQVRTAQQLMADVLTLNGVDIGWTVDWQAVDWSIPADVFAQQGSYISALNIIAEAAGSYIQPHATSQILHVLPKYPHLPWNWGDVTPDYEIPSAVATVEGFEWIDKPIYDRVFVSGMQNGILAQVTRAGTAGGSVAPMVTDALITAEAAGRQRATPILSDTGRQARVSLRLPVLPETGLITPGKFVRYVDGANTYIGLSRGLQADIQSPEAWQTIELETHV